MNINKQLTILLLILTGNISIVLGQETWQSDLVKIDEEGNLTYLPDPASGNIIPDFSAAGYKSGDVPIPDVEVKFMLDPIEGDNTSQIQSAINKVNKMDADENGIKGAVLLNPGKYEIHGTIRLKHSGVILRGSGRGDDTTVNTHLVGVQSASEGRSIVHIGGGTKTQFETEIPDSRSNILDDTVEVGQKYFHVEDVSKYNIGDEIVIHHPCTNKWLESVDYGGTAGDDPWNVDEQPIIYLTTITDIKCNTIYTNSPVYNNLIKDISQSYIYIHDNTGFVENTGLENLRIDIEYDESNSESKNHASTAVRFTQAQNSWVKNCEFLHFYFAGVDIFSSSNLTIESCEANNPKSPSGSGYKYNYCANIATQNVLFKNCIARKGRHNFVSNGTSSVAGIVFHNCTSIDPLTASEGHRRWSTGILFDNFKDYGNNPGLVLGLHNRGSWGTGHGWSSASSVAWNCDVRRSEGDHGQIVIQKPPSSQNFAIGCKGIVNHLGPFPNETGYIEGSNKEEELLPASLYEAQLNYRLKGENEELNIHVDEQVACESFTWVDGNTYMSSTDTPTFMLQNQYGCDSLVQLHLISQ